MYVCIYIYMYICMYVLLGRYTTEYWIYSVQFSMSTYDLKENVFTVNYII